MTDRPRAIVKDGQPTLILNGVERSADAEAMAEARQLQPNLTPVPLCTDPSFGFGDRIGWATPGHVQAIREAGGSIKPIFAQQSIREMTRTERSARRVMDEAQFGMLLAGWTDPAGADADHLKTPEDVDRTAEVGFTFFTIDPSDHVDEQTDNYDESTLRAEFEKVRGEVDWVDQYQGRTVKLSTGTTITFDEEACMRCAVKYGRAINHAKALAAHIAKVHQANGRGHEIELSVDETEQPTTLAEHWIVADQCLKAGMQLVSLAPRFIGDMEKGVDYKGDLAALEASMNDHAAIARELGPYKLSLHSGSDKLSMYTPFARATGGLFHVKTAGTSYLEALRAVLRHDEALFRRIVTFARQRYDIDKATYHVSGTVEGTPPPDELNATELEQVYLERWEDVTEPRGFVEPGRQILHCTFGSVLTDPDLSSAVRDVLKTHPDTYAEVLTEHFTRHLQALTAGM